MSTGRRWADAVARGRVISRSSGATAVDAVLLLSLVDVVMQVRGLAFAIIVGPNCRRLTKIDATPGRHAEAAHQRKVRPVQDSRRRHERNPVFWPPCNCRAALRSLRTLHVGGDGLGIFVCVTNSASQVEVLRRPVMAGIRPAAAAVLAREIGFGFTVDDPHRCRIVLMKEGRVAFGQRPEVRTRRYPLRSG